MHTKFDIYVFIIHTKSVCLSHKENVIRNTKKKLHWKINAGHTKAENTLFDTLHLYFLFWCLWWSSIKINNLCKGPSNSLVSIGQWFWKRRFTDERWLNLTRPVWSGELKTVQLVICKNFILSLTNIYEK